MPTISSMAHAIPRLLFEKFTKTENGYKKSRIVKSCFPNDRLCGIWYSRFGPHFFFFTRKIFSFSVRSFSETPHRQQINLFQNQNSWFHQAGNKKGDFVSCCKR